VSKGPAGADEVLTGARNAETTNYYLLHLTLMREYLDLEFRDIEPVMPFEYSLERVIDDFILLAVFIGNDFMPHLPDLHIHENGLERLFEVYKRILPSLGTSTLRGLFTLEAEEAQTVILTRVVSSTLNDYRSCWTR
jgi:5'-3' exonuclease